MVLVKSSYRIVPCGHKNETISSSPTSIHQTHPSLGTDFLFSQRCQVQASGIQMEVSVCVLPHLHFLASDLRFFLKLSVLPYKLTSHIAYKILGCSGKCKCNRFSSLSIIFSSSFVKTLPLLLGKKIPDISSPPALNE